MQSVQNVKVNIQLITGIKKRIKLVTTGLIDGDIVVYKVACKCSHYEAIPILTRMIMNESAIRGLYSDAIVFLSSNELPRYRHEILPSYKAHRPEEKPRFFYETRDHLLANYVTKLIKVGEADDGMGYHQTDRTVICSIDKDLNMIPGLHYNSNKQSLYSISDLEGIQYFYKQMLIGDVADNIKGVQGLGPKKAAKLIEPLTTEQEMFDIVSKLYNDPDRFIKNAICLWIQQIPQETWLDRQLELPSDEYIELITKYKTIIDALYND